MALRNDDSVPALGKRLLDLMEESNYDSPKALATALYDQKLVPIQVRTQDIDEYDMRISAIGSIEKKIVRHIKTGSIADKTGQFLPAYCKLLNCSSDYILGLTPIRTADYNIRQMSEMTGLDENILSKFTDYNNEDNEHIAYWWSYILSQNLFEEIPDNLLYASYDLEEQYRIECVLEALQWQIDHCPKDHKKDSYRLDSDLMEYEERHETKIASFQGLLYKVTRMFTDTIEKHIIESKMAFKETEREEDLFHVKALAKQGVHYYNFRDSESEVVSLPDDIWEQLPQSYPFEGREIAKKLMNERLLAKNKAFFQNHPNYTGEESFQDHEQTPEDLQKIERYRKHLENLDIKS